MHIASMSLGIFDFLIDWIASLVGTVIGWVFDIIMQIVNRMIYSVAKQILFIVDAIQGLFRRLAGLDKYWIVENGKTSEYGGDILISLMSNETVLEILLTLTLVAVAMVIIATIIKVVQSEFTTEGSKNSKGGIIGQAIKSLIMFILVPVLCFGGVLVSNVLLKALDGATGGGVEASMASQVFVSAASSANRARNGDISSKDPLAKFLSGTVSADGKQHTDGNGYNNNAQFAAAIDTAFRQKKSFGKNQPESGSGIVQTIINSIFSVAIGGAAGAVMEAGTGSVYGVTTYENIYMVGTYYDIGQMNMIILIGGSIMACYVMLVTSFGLVMRLFKAAILFMISPPVIAIAPLDKGNAFSSWRKQFIAEVLAGYGAVLGLNLFFIVLPLLNNINLFPDFGSTNALGNANASWTHGTTVGGFGGTIYNDLAHLLFTIVGLYMMKDLIKMVGDIAGGSDAMGAGEGMAKKAGATALKVGVAAAGVATGGAGLALGKVIGKGAVAGSKRAAIASKLTDIGHAGMKSAGNQAHFAVQKLKGKANEFLGTDFNAETDPEKELEKKEKQQKAREEREKNGTTTLGDTVGNAGRTLGTKISGLNKHVKGNVFGYGSTNAESIGEATGFESDATAIARKKAKDTSAAHQRAAQSGDSDEVVKAKGNSHKDMSSLTADDIATATTTAVQHMNNAKEGEQSQQIWRGMQELLKQIADAMNRQKLAQANIDVAQAKVNAAKKPQDKAVAEAELIAAQTNKASIDSELALLKGAFNEQKKSAEIQLNDISIQSKIEAEIRTKYAKSGPASQDEFKKAIADAVKRAGITDEEAFNKMAEKITEKFETELQKVAPK